MVGLYGLIVLFIWLGIGWLLQKFWRAAKSPVKDWSKTAYYALGVILFLLWCWPMFGKKLYYDAQVWVMCKSDGGIKVYETVELPADKFNRWGQIDFFKPTKGEDALGKDYIYKSNTTYIVKGEDHQIALMRHHDLVYRRFDNKLLGEQVSYARRGGDIPGFWHPSSFSCPDYQGDSLLKRLFLKLK